MAYKALYRTYRPQKFEDVIGQEVIVRTLQNALANNKTTHAYLFSGPRGTGKTTVARILAKALNCDNGPTNEPCDKCQSCLEIIEGNSPDVIEIDAASNNGVDEIREIREKVKFLPAGAKYKIYIIDEVHMLTTSAFNALLKTLEEPPKHVVFILATTEPHKVLPTILSRCQRYDFKSLTINDIVGALDDVAKQENIKVSGEALVGIAESAEGGLRDALSYLDQAIALSDDEVTVDDVNNVTGNLSHDKIIELAGYFEEKNIVSALNAVNELLNYGKEVNKVISGLLQFYRDILMYKNIKEGEFSRYIFTKPGFVKLAKTLEEQKVFYYVDVLSDAQIKIRTSSTPHIFLEVALIKMINVSQDDLDLIAKIKGLEERIMLVEMTGSSTISSSLSAEELEKVALMDEKISRVIAEFARMDIPTLIKRIRALEENTKKESGADSAVLQSSIDANQEDIQFLKVTYKALQNKIDNLRSENIDELVDRMVLIEDAIKKNKPTINYTEVEKFVDRKLDEQLSTIDKKLEQLTVNEVDPAVEKVYIPVEKSTEKIVEKVIVHEDDKVVERLDKIEANIYRLMSGQLSNTVQPKKVKVKGKYSQTVLFGDDYTPIDDIEVPKVEKADFGDLTKNDIAEKIDKVEETPVEDTNLVKEETTPVVEEAPAVEKTIEAVEETVLENVDEGVAEEVIEEIEEEIIDQDNEDEEESFIKPDLKPDTLSPAERSLNKSLENLARTPTNDLFASEREELMKQVITVKGDNEVETKATEDVKITEEKPVEKTIKEEAKSKEEAPAIEQIEEVVLDEYERYDVAVIERILTSSLSAEARNEKARLTNLWRNLVFAASANDQIVAEMLQEGTIAAVGNFEFIIVYPDAASCNQVMRRKFKRRSLKMLYDLLLANYNYLALPEKVWIEKRTEYVNEYNIGRKHPQLTPIEDPHLKVVIDPEEIEPGQQIVNRAANIFGDDPLIEIKK